MATVNYVVDLKIKHPRLMVLLNTPFILLGFKPPFIKCFISIGNPRAVEVKK